MAELALAIQPKMKRAKKRNAHVTSFLYQYSFGYLYIPVVMIGIIIILIKGYKIGILWGMV